MKKTHPIISGVSGVMSHVTPTVIFFPLKVENIKVMSTAQFREGKKGSFISRDMSEQISARHRFTNWHETELEAHIGSLCVILLKRHA